MMNIYRWQSEVRSSELDALGIVNNSVYLVYLEHCRHKHMKSKGIDFVDLFNQGYSIVIRSCEINFKRPLRSGDQFIVTSEIFTKNKVRLLMSGKILSKDKGEEILSAKFVVTGFNKKGKLCLPTALLEAF